MRGFTVAGAVLTVAMGAIGFTASPVLAATSITDPSTKTVVVKLDGRKPATFTVSARGFEPYQSVYIEQCNGRVPTDDDWRPAVDCDLGTSPAAAIADTDGNVTFAADDPNHAFRPFVGASPQASFNCLAPDSPSLDNDLPDYRDCQVRVSTNNTRETDDQAFLRLQLPEIPAATVAAETRSGSSGSGAGSGSVSGQSGSGKRASEGSGEVASGQLASDQSESGLSEVSLIGALLLVAAVAGGAAFVLYRRRSRRVAA